MHGTFYFLHEYAQDGYAWLQSGGKKDQQILRMEPILSK